MSAHRARHPAPARLRSALLALAALAASAAANTDTDALVRTRLLHMAGGGVIRGPSRMRDGAWEIQRGDHWTALPPRVVTAAHLETDKLDEARARRLAARREGPAARVDLARWMATEGLLTEAFRELDQVLDDDPDQPDALGLLHGGSLPVARPPVPSAADDPADAARTRDELIAYAGGAPSSLREMIVADLRADDADEALRDALVASLTAPPAGARDFACLALRRLFPRQPHPELLRRALLDTRAEVRHGAALALRDAEDPEWSSAVLANLAHASPTVRTHVAEALAVLRPPAAVRPLVEHLAALHTSAGSGDSRATVFFGTQRAFLQGFDAQVANSAAIAKPLVGTVQDGVTLDARLLSTGPAGGATERRAVRLALEAITGASPGTSGRAWERWLAQQNG